VENEKSKRHQPNNILGNLYLVNYFDLFIVMEVNEMKQEEVEKAKSFTDFGVVPNWNMLGRELDRVAEGANKQFQTKLKKDLYLAVFYAYFGSSRFCGGGWCNSQSERPDITIGAKCFPDEVSLEDSLNNPPDMDTYLHEPAIDFLGFATAGYGRDMDHYIQIKPESKYTGDNSDLAEFLSSKKKVHVIIVPDQKDEEVFSFIIPREPGEGYVLVRFREPYTQNKDSGIQETNVN